MWPSNIFISVLSGLQHFPLLNLLRIINITFAQVGGILVLILTRDLQAFISFLIINAALMLIIYGNACRKRLPGLSFSPRVYFKVIQQVRKYSLDMNANSIISVIFVQADRILISALLPLRFLGYYNAVYGIARQITNIQEYVNSAMFPVMVAKLQSESADRITPLYLRYAQQLIYITILPVFILMFFAYDILRLWTNEEIARAGSISLILLSSGFLLSSVASTSWNLSVASGNTRRPLVINSISLIFYLPMMFLFLKQWNITGASLTWALLNFSYLFTMIPMIQSRILKISWREWFIASIMPHTAIGICVFGIGAVLHQIANFQVSWIPVVIMCTAIYLIGGFFALAAPTRQLVTSTARGVFKGKI